MCGRTYQFNKDFGDASVRASDNCPEYSENPNLVAAYSALASQEDEVFTKLSAKFDLQAEREKAAAEAAAAREIARLAPAPTVEVETAVPAPVAAPVGPVATPQEAPVATASVPTSVPVPQANPTDAGVDKVAPTEAQPAEKRSVFGRVKGLFGG
ncbi:MAG: hypothetical protein AAF737_04035 [Pseudomonadota bacterium]